jgi:hypothetical protein
MSLPEEKAASALAACQSAQEKIGNVQELLRNPGTESVERAISELSEVAALLNSMISTRAYKFHPAAQASFQEIRRAARSLRPQIEHASKFCMGWIQVRLGTGYTRQGFPVFVENEARSSFEG